MTRTQRITGVKSAELITDAEVLQEVLESLVNEPSRWVLVTKMDWKANGFVIVGDTIVVPPKSGRKNHGDVIASVGDYVVNMNDGRRFVVFTPEMKERVARNDFSWIR